MIITTPVSGAVFGPGFEIQLESDFIGPLEPGAYWELFLTAPANESIIAHMFIPDALHGLRYVMINQDAGLQIPSIAIPEAVTGEPGQLQIILQQPTFGPAETEEVPIVLDRQAGQVQELNGLLNQKINAIPAGLTEEQAESLVITQAAVTAGFGLDPLNLVGDLVQAIGASNPLGYGSLSSPMDCFSGDGTMPDPEPLLPKWGLYWVASVIPAELGHRHGQSEEYPSRLVQFRTVHEVGGVEMVTEIVDSTTHGELWRFKFQRPRRVEYSVLPGVTICASWWQFP